MFIGDADGTDDTDLSAEREIVPVGKELPILIKKINSVFCQNAHYSNWFLGDPLKKTVTAFT